MFFFSRKNKKAGTKASRLTDEEKLSMLNSIYDDFVRRVDELERIRDEKITALIKDIDARRMQDILKKI